MRTLAAATTVLALLFASTRLTAEPAAPVEPGAGSVAAAERAFEAARYWHDQLELTRARGIAANDTGVSLVELERSFRAERELAAAALGAAEGTAGATGATADDARALALMRAAMAGELAPPAEPAASSAHAPDCAGDLVAQAGGGDDPDPLSDLLYRCYGAAAMAIRMDGETTDRLSILARLRAESDRGRRRALFESLLPLGRVVNGDDDTGSPYRELVRRTSIAWRRDGSPIDRQLVALGVEPLAFEASLVRFLESWRAFQPPAPIEPWDLHFSTAEASRALAAVVPPERLEPIARRAYADLGANPAALGVRLDLAPREGKTPVAFSNFGARRSADRILRKQTEAWIFATYSAGGFDNLVELLHELGHAVHIAAIDTRPAYLDWPDLDSFTEALAELIALEAYEPAWQESYLGRSVPLAAALRSKYGAIALDVAWALFEIRIHRDPARSPNELWSELASRYLGVAPHPEWSWWMLRGQLVSDPGYMANYAIGAVIAADLRQRARELHGPFTAADAGWYDRLSGALYRFGRERDSRAVIEGFLGRGLSSAALIADLERGRSAAPGVAGAQ